MQEVAPFMVRPAGRGMMSLLPIPAPAGGRDMVICVNFSGRMGRVPGRFTESFA